MLRMSKKLLFAIEAVLDIAYHARGEAVQSADITERQGIPKRYLEQVLQQLVRARILAGTRGPKGGYRLARERRKITVADIVEVVRAMETATDPMEDPAGSRLGHDIVRPMWRAFEQKSLDRLAEVTVEDLCAKAQGSGIRRAYQQDVDFTI